MRYPFNRSQTVHSHSARRPAFSACLRLAFASGVCWRDVGAIGLVTRWFGKLQRTIIKVAFFKSGFLGKDIGGVLGAVGLNKF